MALVSGMLLRMNLTSLLAVDVEDFVRIAILVAGHDDDGKAAVNGTVRFRDAVLSQLLDSSHKLYDDALVVKEWEALIKNCHRYRHIH